MEEIPPTSLSQYLKVFFTSQVIAGDFWSIKSTLEIPRYLEPKKIQPFQHFFRYKILGDSPGAVGGSHGREAPTMWQRKWNENQTETTNKSFGCMFVSSKYESSMILLV